MQQNARFPIAAKGGCIVGWRRRYGLFAIHVLMAMTVVVLLTLVLAAAEASLYASRSLSAANTDGLLFGGANSLERRVAAP
jgi:hypothetical protein